MKRRLSVALSTVGDPSILFLDEPTTGMDPLKRRDIWTFVSHFKEGAPLAASTAPHPNPRVPIRIRQEGHVAILTSHPI